MFVRDIQHFSMRHYYFKYLEWWEKCVFSRISILIRRDMNQDGTMDIIYCKMRHYYGLRILLHYLTHPTWIFTIPQILYVRCNGRNPRKNLITVWRRAFDGREFIPYSLQSTILYNSLIFSKRTQFHYYVLSSNHINSRL